MRWTNQSVKNFAGSHDPISHMKEHAKDIVLWALDKGWQGPPFDPLKLADLLKIPVVPSASIPDARTTPIGARKFQIEFNPTRPRGRVRFSIAHEIAHTFFNDCGLQARHRHQSDHIEADDWQLEMLCNIGAAELIMPIGSLSDEINENVSIDDVLTLRDKYGVSTEALLNRVATATDQDWAMFCASHINKNGGDAGYQVDYVITAPNWTGSIQSGLKISRSSVVNDCRAIGFTAKDVETWGDPSTRVKVECVGLPSYPGSSLARVAGLLKRTRAQKRRIGSIDYFHGNALSPRGKGHRIVCQIVNDKTANWGGAGFASAVRRKWPNVQKNFKAWVSEAPDRLSLGNIVSLEAEKEIEVFCIVAQKGYGASQLPRIRYSALERGLRELAESAANINASIHMPRIGVGHAGGNWIFIEELIERELMSKGLSVTIYDLPQKQTADPTDDFLRLPL